MRFAEDDRVRVSRVIIEKDGTLEELRSCWVSITPGCNRIQVWRSENQQNPDLLLGLEQVIIEWRAAQGPSLAPLPD